MLVFTYSEARKKLAEVLDLAKENEVLIKRRNGEIFCLSEFRKESSPLNVSGLSFDVTTNDLVAAVREGRER
ncbi:MAG: type II toxin-antitoxin system Phd/YefM family antitoxin [Candidatus Aegiribacteria sp.]|nr:type II toxin-antitoxin system Phd/YefM family antitoxin [Candidatus Aegiribacteria sp.]